MDIGYVNERLENYCMAWSIDSVPIKKFIEVCETNLWDDYLKSVKLIKKILHLGNMSDLFDSITVAPSFNEDYGGELIYHIMYDEEEKLFLCMGLNHNLVENMFSISLVELDHRYCDGAKPAYKYDYTYGPFLEYALFKNQELYERARMMYSKLSKKLRIENASI